MPIAKLKISSSRNKYLWFGILCHWFSPICAASAFSLKKCEVCRSNKTEFAMLSTPKRYIASMGNAIWIVHEFWIKLAWYAAYALFTYKEEKLPIKPLHFLMPAPRSKRLCNFFIKYLFSNRICIISKGIFAWNLWASIFSTS